MDYVTILKAFKMVGLKIKTKIQLGGHREIPNHIIHIYFIVYIIHYVVNFVPFFI